jgi:hypothetical protein
MGLALLLPLQSFALPPCGRAAGTEAALAAQHHCAQESTALRQHAEHGCGKCCCGAAFALTSVPGIAALPQVPELSRAVIGWPPSIALDRLDRPPRLIPS